MKKVNLIVIILAVIISCTNSLEQQNESNQSASEVNDCDNSVPFGNINFCLPEIGGMKECFSIPIVKKIASKIESENKTVFAFYLNDKTHEKIDVLDMISLDDYAVFYASDIFKEKKADRKDLIKITNMVTDNTIKRNWNEINSIIEKNNGSISIDRPILIEDYSPSDYVNSFIFLTKVSNEDSEFIMVFALNLLLAKEHLLWMGYYKEYDGKESIKKIKAKSDYIALKFIDDNI